MIRFLLSLTAVVALAGCASSSANGGDSAASAPATEFVAPTDLGSADVALSTDARVDTPAAPRPSNIVNNYDTASCADWKVTDAQNRQIVASYFIVKARNPKVSADLEIAVETAITTACNNVDPSLTVARVALLSIKTLGDSI